MQLNINTNAAVIFTNKLEKLHKSALPSAIRGSLNKAAFHVKKTTMPEKAAETFKKRQSNFFKANSRVDMATGFDVNSMKASVGFTETNLKGQSNFAVKDLEQQEHGGTIKRKAFIPMRPGRSGGDARPVRPGNRLSAIKKIVNSSNAKGTNKKQQFLNAVSMAGVGGFVMGNKNKNVLWRVESIGKGGKIKMKPIYSFKAGRNVSVNGTHFMEKSSLKSAEKIDDFYVEEAKRQIERLAK